MPVFAVATCPGCKVAVSGSNDKTLRVWDVATGSLTRTIEGHRYQGTKGNTVNVPLSKKIVGSGYKITRKKSFFRGKWG